MPFPYTTAYEIDPTLAAGVDYSYGEKVAICAWGGALYSTGFDLVSSSGLFYVWKSTDGGITWTAISTGIDSDGSISADYYWSGTNSTFYVAVLCSGNVVRCGSFDMATDTFAAWGDDLPTANYSPYVAYVGGLVYVLHITPGPAYVPSMAYSSGSGWTTYSLGDGSGGLQYLCCGMDVDSATGNVHMIHLHFPAGGTRSIAHSITNSGSDPAGFGTDWVSVGTSSTSVEVQRVKISGDSRIMVLMHRVSGGIGTYGMVYSDSADIITPTAEGGTNPNWNDVVFSGDETLGAHGDLVSRPDGWAVFWVGDGTGGNARIKAIEVTDPLGTLTPVTVYDATGLVYDLSAALLDDGEYHIITSLPWSGGFHSFGDLSNWLLGLYGGVEPTTVYNYAY